MTATKTKAPVETNAHGFPIVNCSRCGGSGKYGPLSVQNGTCFKCSGSGKAIKGGKVAKAWVDFVNAYRAATRVSIEEVQPGELIGEWRGWDKTCRREEYRTVERVEVGERQYFGQRVMTAATHTNGETIREWISDGTEPMELDPNRPWMRDQTYPAGTPMKEVRYHWDPITLHFTDGTKLEHVGSPITLPRIKVVDPHPYLVAAGVAK